MLQATSLSRRLLLAASIFIGVALIIVGVVLFFVLHRFVQGQIDQRLDTQIAFLSSMLRSQNGTLTLAGNAAPGPPTVSVVAIWNTQTALASPCASSVRFPPWIMNVPAAAV